MTRINYRSDSADPKTPLDGRPVESEVVRENFQVMRINASLWAYDTVAVPDVYPPDPFSTLDGEYMMEWDGATTVTVTTAEEHGFSNGDTVIVAGADQSEYNGEYIITVVDSTTFTYTIAGAPTTPATGSPTIRLKRKVGVTSGTFIADTSGKSVYSGGYSPELDTDTGPGGGGLAGDKAIAQLYATGVGVPTLDWNYGAWATPPAVPAAPPFAAGQIPIVEVEFEYQADEITSDDMTDVRPSVGFVNFGSGSLQDAYDAGNAIVTSGGASIELSGLTNPILNVTGTSKVTGDLWVTGKLTVDGPIDPPTYIEMTTTNTAGLSPHTLVIDQATAEFGVIDLGGNFVPIENVAADADLDGDYRRGQVIDPVDLGPVELRGDDTDNVLLSVLQTSGITSSSLLKVENNSLGIGINVLQHGANSSIGVVQDGNLPDSADEAVVYILSQQTGTAGAALRVRSDIASYNSSLGLAHFYYNATGSSRVVRIDNAGTGVALDIDQTSTDSIGNAIEVANSGTGAAIRTIASGSGGYAGQFDQYTDQVGLFIRKLNVGGVAGNAALYVDCNADSYGLYVQQDGASRAAYIRKTHAGSDVALLVTNSGTGAGFYVSQVGAGAAAYLFQQTNNVSLHVQKTATGGGNCLHVFNSGIGKGLYIEQIGDAQGAHINKTATGTQTAFLVQNSGSGYGVKIDGGPNSDRSLLIDHSGTTGHAVEIFNRGTLEGCVVNNLTGASTAFEVNNSATTNALRIDHAPSSAIGVEINKTHTACNDDALRITDEGTGTTVSIYSNNTTAAPTTGLTVFKAGGAGNGLTVFDSGSGDCLSLGKFGSGRTLYIDKQHTGSSHVITVANAGTGNDIYGNGGNWYVDKNGNAHFNSVNPATSTLLSYDSGWYKQLTWTPTQIPHGLGSEPHLLQAMVRSNGFGCGECITLCHQSNHEDYIKAFCALDSTYIYQNASHRASYLQGVGTYPSTTERNPVNYNGEYRIRCYNKTPNYDSGWFAVSNANTYILNHNLGVYPHYIQVEFAEFADGSGWRIPAMCTAWYNGINYDQGGVVRISTTQVDVRIGAVLGRFRNFAAGGSSTFIAPTTGYCRVKCWNWVPDYDSGWIAINTTHQSRSNHFVHDFRHFPALVNCYIAQNSDGSGWAMPALHGCWTGSDQGTGIIHIGDRIITQTCGNLRIANFIDSSGVVKSESSGYVKVLAWK